MVYTRDFPLAGENSYEGNSISKLGDRTGKKYTQKENSKGDNNPNKQNKYNEVLSYEKETSNPNLLYELAYAKLFTNQAKGGLEYINKALEIENDDKFLFLKNQVGTKFKRIILIGDAEPHPTPRKSGKYSKEFVQSLADAKKIKINAILLPKD